MTSITINTTGAIRALVLCQDPLVRAGLVGTLRGQSDFELLPDQPWVPTDPSLQDAGVDLVVADYEHALALLEGCRKPSAVRHALIPNVLVVTHRDSEGEIRHALEVGVRGYLILGCGLDELVMAARAVRRGIRHVGTLAAQRLADSVACSSLTFRETDVLRLVAKGHSNKVVARQLDIAIGTVKSHLKAIFEKLDATSRTEVAAVAEQRGLLVFPERTGQIISRLVLGKPQQRGAHAACREFARPEAAVH